MNNPKTNPEQSSSFLTISWFQISNSTYMIFPANQRPCKFFMMLFVLAIYSSIHWELLLSYRPWIIDRCSTELFFQLLSTRNKEKMAASTNDLMTWTTLPPRARNRNNRNTNGILATEQGSYSLPPREHTRNNWINFTGLGDLFPLNIPKRFCGISNYLISQKKKPIHGDRFPNTI